MIEAQRESGVLIGNARSSQGNSNTTGILWSMVMFSLRVSLKEHDRWDTDSDTGWDSRTPAL